MGVIPVLLAVAAAVAGGACATWLGVPLGWLLGSLVACAALSVAGVTLQPPPGGRHMGQLTIGVGIGLKLTAAVLGTAVLLAPYMLASTLYVSTITTLAAAAMARLANVDRRTAFLATSSAGVTEMAVLARTLKADADVVALTQTLRVALVVLTVPPLVLMFGSDGGLVSGGAQAVTPPPMALVALFATSTIVSLAVSRVPSFPAPWLFGPMMVGATAALTGWQAGELPREALVAAQLLIGMMLGCRFNREALTRLPRATAAGVTIAAALIVAGLAGGIVLHHVSGIPIETAVLAVAPAGIAEMGLTAKLLHLDPVTVTAFHLVRIITVTGCARLSLALYERLDRTAEIPSSRNADETRP
jgi:membrane AbrB-like protein